MSVRPSAASPDFPTAAVAAATWTKSMNARRVSPTLGSMRTFRIVAGPQTSRKTARTCFAVASAGRLPTKQEDEAAGEALLPLIAVAGPCRASLPPLPSALSRAPPWAGGCAIDTTIRLTNPAAAAAASGIDHKDPSSASARVAWALRTKVRKAIPLNRCGGS